MAIARQNIFMPPGGISGAIGGLLRGDLWDGPEVSRLEKAYAEVVGVPHAITAPSGRAAMKFILEAMDLRAGDQVLCAAFGYPVVPYIVRHLGLELGLVDIELGTLGMDPQALERAIRPKTKAVLVTHLYGMPCRINEILEITRAHGVNLIEDCAHCYGASVGGKKVGSFGRAGYFSFETSKVINTMGGGIAVTADAELSERIRSISAREPQKKLPWLLKRLAQNAFEAMVTSPLPFNAGVYPALRLASREKAENGGAFASGYLADQATLTRKMGRFTNYQARLALRQLERVDQRIAKAVTNAERLMGALRGRVEFQEPFDDTVKPNFMLVTARFQRVPEIAHRLLRLGVDTKYHYQRDCGVMFEGTGPACPNATRAEREILHPPAYAKLSTAAVDRVISSIEKVLDELGD